MSDKSDYSFMKSGFNILNQPNTTTEELTKNVTALVLTFCNNALESSSKYVNHCNRTIVTKKDLKLCLMVETFKFLKRNDTLEKAEQMKSKIEDGSIFDDEYDDSEDEEEVINDLTEEEEFKYSNCKCTDCIFINNIEVIWSKWKPSTPLDILLKKSIDEKF